MLKTWWAGSMGALFSLNTRFLPPHGTAGTPTPSPPARGEARRPWRAGIVTPVLGNRPCPGAEGSCGDRQTAPRGARLPAWPNPLRAWPRDQVLAEGM